MARIILMFKADDRMAEFMRRVLIRSEPIVDVEVIEPERSIVREVALLKTRKLNEKQLWQVVQQIEGAGGRVVESKGNVLIAELSGEHDEIERVIKALGSEVLKEVARSGQVLISREIS